MRKGAVRLTVRVWFLVYGMLSGVWRLVMGVVGAACRYYFRTEEADIRFGVTFAPSESKVPIALSSPDTNALRSHGMPCECRRRSPSFVPTRSTHIALQRRWAFCCCYWGHCYCVCARPLCVDWVCCRGRHRKRSMCTPAVR